MALISLTWGLPGPPMGQEHYLSSALGYQSFLQQCWRGAGLQLSYSYACLCPWTLLMWTLAYAWASWLDGRAVLSLWVCLAISRLCLILTCGLTTELGLRPVSSP